MRRGGSSIALRLGAGLVGADLAAATLGWVDSTDHAIDLAEVGGASASSAVSPAAPLAARVRRVRFELTPGGAAVTHEIVLPKGALTALLPAGVGEGALFVSFTAQLRPLAFEATRVPLDADGRTIEAAALPLRVEHLVVRPATAPTLLGLGHAAGHLLHLPRGDEPILLRLRSAIAVEPGHKTVELLARLGMRDGGYLPLDRIEVGAALGTTLRGARATLCGPRSDPRPLALVFHGYPTPRPDASIVEPSKATRRSDDDLCLEAQID